MDDKNLDELLNTLKAIAFLKSMLPFQLHGHVNTLGLYVPAREAGHRSRLQAGGSFRSYLDAWQEGEGNWQVMKFDKDTWERRFAHLVEPTYQIADFLSNRVASFGDLDSAGASALDNAFQHYRDTGVWLGLPKVPEEVMNKLAKERAGARLEKERRKILSRIAYYEAIVRKDPSDRDAWFSLSEWYFDEQRYKDMENALKMAVEKIDEARPGGAYSLSYRKLGLTYLAALSVSIRGKGITVFIRLPWNVMTAETSEYTTKELLQLAKRNMKLTTEALGYSTNQLRELAKENLSKAYEMDKKAGNKTFLREMDLALNAANTLSIEAFEELDKYQEREKDDE